MTTAAGGLDRAARVVIIDAILDKLRDAYIFPDKAETAAQAVRQRLENGAYDATVSGPDFAAALTAHLQAATRDKHLRVYFDVEPQPFRDGERPDPKQEDYRRRLAAGRNYGFERIE